MATAWGNIVEDGACTSSSDDIERVTNVEAAEDVLTDGTETQLQEMGDASGRSGQLGEVDTDDERVVHPEAERVVNEFTTKTWREDLTLIVEGKELYVISGVLLAVSPVFSSMLEKIFREEGAKAMELPGGYDDVVEFLRCIYPSIMKPITEDNVLKVAPLIHTYQIGKAEKTCEEVMYQMVCGGSTPESMCSVLSVASSCHMASLSEKCLAEITKRRTSTIDAAVDKLKLSADEKLEIKKTKNEMLEEEVEKLNLLVQQERDTCTKLKTHLRKSWIEDLKMSEEQGAEIRVIDLETPGDQQPVSETVLINHMTWIGNVRLKKIDYEDFVTVTLSATGDRTWHSWTCKAKVSCSITQGNTCLWKQHSVENMHSYYPNIDISLDIREDELDARFKICVVLVIGDIVCNV